MITYDVDNLNPEEKQALVEAVKEFNTLVEGRENFNTSQMLELRDYIRARTDLDKADDKLTAREKAWKQIFKKYSVLLGERIGAAKLAELDHIESVQSKFGVMQDKMASLLELGKEIALLSVQQYSFLVVYADKDHPENNYQKGKTQFENLIFRTKNSKEEKIKQCYALIDLVNAYKKGLVGGLQKINDQIQKKLAIFEKELDSFPEQYAVDIKERGALFIDFLAEAKEWLRLSKESNLARIMATNSVITQLELDAYLPDRVIKNDGDVSGQEPEEEREWYKNKLISYGTLWATASEKEKEIQEKKEVLAKHLFGDFYKELPTSEKIRQDFGLPKKAQAPQKKKTSFWNLFKKTA